jgi:OmpA-OmpF porin, OOP family
MNPFKIFILLYIALALKDNCFSQQKQRVHQSSLGIDFILTDYGPATYNKLKFYPVNKWVPGVSINYTQSFSEHYSFTIMSTASFHDSILKNAPKGNIKALLETSLGLNRKIGNPLNRIQPFVTSGIGSSVYNGNFGMFIPAGVGLQFKITQEVFTTLNVQYRFGIKSPLLSHGLYSIGIAGTINRKRKEEGKVIPVVNYGDNYTQIANMDRDHDGIIDAQDSCIDIPGYVENKGCPMEKRKNYDTNLGSYISRKNEIKISMDSATVVLNQLAKLITFESNSYVLQQSSHQSIYSAIELLKEFSQINLLIEGHTDNVGDSDKNKLLSQKRAESVLNFLQDNGINSNRLTAVGYGETRPIVSNETRFGRSQNRRVELRAISLN